ncbi:hypothetical protein [Rhizohabitans arisaemae]|uniref:hypothetical protein n=1 Tax=Rhizohabitans arisaemae TaxID=2720610 RepID=UPI0024B1AE8C|nr:hypothetical protein [Rhizohabitans arisaemae]
MLHPRLPLVAASAVLIALAWASAVPAPAAGGTVPHRRVVSADPADHTPHVLDGIVNAFAIVGDRVVVGGSFTEVQEASTRQGEGERFDRRNVFAFDLATGRVDRGFAPDLDGTVWALAPGDGGTVYAGGSFGWVDAEPRPGLTRLRLADGAPVPGFAVAGVSGGSVFALARRGSHLYVGGDFTAVGGSRTALARLDAANGGVDPSFKVTPSHPREGATKVYALAVNRQGDRLAVDGSFTRLNGLSRPQLGLVDIGGATARVAKWRTNAYAAECRPVFPSYVRGLDFSPDGKYFVVVTTGGIGGATKLCDTAARWETYKESANLSPTWVNYTGGDSLYSVAVTGSAVYVGGHQRWLNNPKGANSAGPGAVARTGIGAIHPVTGKALPWNPTRERGIGVKAFLAYPGGLLVGSDTVTLGREYHARVGLFPLPSGG